jgi:outer membrane protein
MKRMKALVELVNNKIKDKKMKSFCFAISAFAFVSSNANALSLQEGLDNIYKSNPALQVIKNQLNITKQQKQQAWAGFLPNVIASYSIADTDTNFDNRNSIDGSPSTGSVELTQKLFTGGSTLASFKIAKLNQRVAQFDYRSQQQNIFLDAANAYLSVLTAEIILEFNERQVATNKEEMKRVKQRFNLGDITLPYLKEFEARLSGYIANKERAYGDLQEAKSTFKAIFGLDTEELIWPELKMLEEITLEQVLDNAKNSNPNIVKNRLLLDVSKQSIKVAKSNFMPTVAAVASWTSNSNQTVIDDTEVTSIGVRASVPLYTGGENKAKYKQAKFEKIQAEDILNQNMRDIESEATDAYNEVQVQISRVKSLKNRLESFIVTTEAIEKQDETGEATIIDVLDARDDEFSAKVDLQLAKQQLVIARLSLLAAMGKFIYEDLEYIFVKVK